MAGSMSMSPPASDAPTPKRGRGRGGGGGRGSRGGRVKAGGAGGAGGRKKRQSTVLSESATAAMSPAAREGSTASISRRSTTAKGGAAASRAGGAAAGGTEGELMDEEEDEDEEGDDELDLQLRDDEYDEQAKERSEAKEALRLLLDQFSPEQFERYEVYRAAGFQKAAVRRLINHLLQQSCSPNIIIGIRGLAKVFVGEIVESARQVQEESSRTGPVAPDDLREAYRRYRAVQDRRGSSRARLFVR